MKTFLILLGIFLIAVGVVKLVLALIARKRDRDG